MGRHSGFDDPAPSGGMTEHFNGLLSPPTAGPRPIQDLTSVLHDPAQHFRLDLDQAPRAITAFRQAAEQLRDLKRNAGRLTEVCAPGRDMVSIDAAKEIGRWAASEEPGSLRWALESGAQQMESVANSLEQQLASYRNTDEAHATQLSRRAQ